MKKVMSFMIVLAADLGIVSPPAGIASFEETAGLAGFIGNILKTLIVLAGVYAVFNFVLAGYAFMSAGDDPKKVQGAWQNIWTLDEKFNCRSNRCRRAPDRRRRDWQSKWRRGRRRPF